MGLQLQQAPLFSCPFLSPSLLCQEVKRQKEEAAGRAKKVVQGPDFLSRLGEPTFWEDCGI